MFGFKNAQYMKLKQVSNNQLGSKLGLWFPGLGKVKFEFKSNY